MGHLGCRQDDPLAFLDHVHEFLLQELQVVHAGSVSAAGEGCADLVSRPRRSGHFGRSASLLVELEQALRGVVNVAERRKVSGYATVLDKRLPPELLEKGQVPRDERG